MTSNVIEALVDLFNDSADWEGILVSMGVGDCPDLHICL